MTSPQSICSCRGIRPAGGCRRCAPATERLDALVRVIVDAPWESSRGRAAAMVPSSREADAQGVAQGVGGTEGSPPTRHPGWDFYRRIGSPRLVLAPMVDQSELPFRLLCRRYGAELCVTPMIHSGVFVRDENARGHMFFNDIDPEDRPLVAQFCGDDPDVLLEAARMVEPHVDAVDLNLGCPQGIAKRGHYGAFLLEEWDLLARIVSTLSKNLSVPVTCKIRLLPSFEDTLELCRILIDAGCMVLTVHGRTKEQKKDQTGPCDWEAIRKIVQAVPVPVIANGGIENMDDVIRCLEVTGAAGVMSSEAILENPGLFTKNFDKVTGQVASQDDLCEQYLALVAQRPLTHMKMVKSHVHKMLYTGLQVHADIRDLISSPRAGIEELQAAARELARRRKEDPSSSLPSSWYLRFRGPVEGVDRRKSKAQQTHEEQLARMIEVDETSMACLFGGSGDEDE